MNKIISTLIAVFFLNVKAIAQDNVYAFKIEYLMPDNSTRPSSFFELLFNGHNIKANNGGMIYFTRETGTSSVLINMTDSSYIISGPSSIAFPEDPKFITTITVHRKSDAEQAYSAYKKMLKSLNIIEDANTKNLLMNQQVKASIDSVFKVVTKKYKISEEDLKNATEILGGREKYFKSISYSLEGYLNEAKDIRDIFKNMLAFSLENPRSFRLFDSTLRAYNNFYSILNNNNNEYEKAVETYWHSPELAIGFHNVFDYAINDIHRSNILSLNKLFVEKANKYIHESNKKRRKELKDEITGTLNSVLPILDNDLVVLENKIKYHIGKLETEREILTN